MGVTFISKKGGVHTPWVRSLSCDKLSMTLQISDPGDREAILSRLEKDHDDGYSFWGPKGRYKAGVRYPMNPDYLVFDDHSDDHNLVIQCDPYDPAMNFFRMEVNPNKSPMKTVQGLLDKLLPGGYSRLVEYGRITRFDATVDVEQAKIDELFFYYPQMTKTAHFLKSGFVETMYIGGQDSPKQFCIYDKAVEIHRKNQQKTGGLVEAIPKKPITRIEARLQPKGGVTFKGLLAFPNPFEKLAVSALKVLSTKYEDDYVWKLFIDSCRFRTMQAALLLLPKNVRVKYHGRIKEAGFVGWWKPDKVWEQLPQVVKRITDPGEKWGYVPNLMKNKKTSA